MLKNLQVKKMIDQPLMPEPGRVDEPCVAGEYASILGQVAAGGRPVIVQRNGEDLAAVVSLEHLELMREVMARKEVEELAARIDWNSAAGKLRPPQSWFEGEEAKPF